MARSVDDIILAGGDVPVFPTVSRNTNPGSVAGLPGLTLPMGLAENVLPMGVELDGPAGAGNRQQN